MKSRLFYLLKTYFGFTARESRGFVFVIPALSLLYFIPSVYSWMLERKHAPVYDAYLERVDSLINAGWEAYQPNSSPVGFVAADSTRRRSTTQRRGSPQLNRLAFNEADSVVLQIVPGIGSAMAGRVVKFRENIGGLHQMEQLLDVFGMNEELMERVFDYFEFSPGIFRKLEVNALDVQALAKHPYINYGAAKVIVAYREQHGPYASAEDLLKIKIFNEEWVERLKPYLQF
ncbi:ComEA family DNA-binding protein [Fontibacter flavus]|uniref:ComEA family DNA-binding protein n=1 Tax=Fontibacter flavus TaxID=654838 RepID=A0ABV6FXP7_9BACT